MNSQPLLWAALVLCTACSGPRGKPMHELAPEINAYRYTGQDRISPGDTLSIKLPFQSDRAWDQEVTVRADGRASFLELDELQVAGMLTSQLDEQLTTAYARVLSGSTSVTVSVLEQAPRLAYVMGSVGTPGPVILPPDQQVTFLQAMALAGGYDTYTAWLGNTHLVRYDPASQSQRTWVLDARIRHWGAPDSILVQAGDVIWVPNTRVDRTGIQLQMWIARMIPFPRILY